MTKSQTAFLLCSCLACFLYEIILLPVFNIFQDILYYSYAFCRRTALKLSISSAFSAM